MAEVAEQLVMVVAVMVLSRLEMAPPNLAAEQLVMAELVMRTVPSLE